MADKKLIFNGVTGKQEEVDFTAEEQTIRDEKVKAWNDGSADRKLAEIRKIRNQKLQESDYLALQDVVLSDAWKDKRKSWRDIPQDYNTEEHYDLLLASSDGKLTHSIWEKP